MSAHKWIWHGFTATRLKHDGTIEEKKLTSEGTARVFVERMNEEGPLAFRTTSPIKPGELRKRNRKKGFSRTPQAFTPEQQKLRAEALKLVKGL